MPVELTPTDKLFIMNLDQNEFQGFSYTNPEFVIQVWGGSQRVQWEPEGNTVIQIQNRHIYFIKEPIWGKKPQVKNCSMSSINPLIDFLQTKEEEKRLKLVDDWDYWDTWDRFPHDLKIINTRPLLMIKSVFVYLMSFSSVRQSDIIKML